MENCKDFGGLFWISAGFPHPPETVPLGGREEGEEKGKEGEEKGRLETEMRSGKNVSFHASGIYDIVAGNAP